MILFSYGSGSTATMFSLRLNAGQHPFSLENIAAVLNVGEKLKSRHEVLVSSSLFLKHSFMTYHSETNKLVCSQINACLLKS